ncbi:MAG: DNA (cytosine-5-)-methyltransferase [Bacillota bacterium]|nr:DNA (cytosine-5-)-methyltransferase [Bacillota bacterium]
MDKTVVELFAGVGGFRVGLENASNEFKTVWANQWEPSRKAQDAYDCYVANFGKSDMHSNVDINEVEINTIPDHSLLVGGFPCQDYSVASTGAKGIEGKKGVLWWNIYNILKKKRPSFVLLENVDRLLKSPSSQRGRDFGVILGCFREQGYSVEWRVINAAEYGFPQRRRRVFIYAFKNDTKYGSTISNYNDAEKVVLQTGVFQKVFKANPYDAKRVSRTKFNIDDIKQISDEFAFKFWNAGCLLGNDLYTQDLKPVEKKPSTLESVLDDEVPEEYYINGDLSKWKYMKGPKKIPRTHKDGHKYIFSEGGIAFPDPIDKPARTMLTSESSSNRSTHIIQDPKTGRLRKLTPRECEALNGFPKDWTNTGMTNRFRYFCMGNALVVGIVERIGSVLKIIIDNE